MITDSLAAIANHLWQSTLFACAAALLTLALRKNSARVRHWLWVAASLKFLVPFSFLIALGSQVHWSTVAVSPPPNFSIVVDEVSRPFTVSMVAVPLPTTEPAVNLLPLVTVLIVGLLWAIGFVGISCSSLIAWRRLAAAVRTGSPIQIGSPIPAISSRSFVEPGVFGIFRPVLLMPAGICEYLTSDEITSVLEHELCHVRHRDNLIGVVQMFVEAVFWFHPLVWWIGKCIFQERERACDEEVLLVGSEPGVYARSILKICELYLESPLSCVSGVTGGNLKKRIEEIMANRKMHELTRGRRLLLAAAAMLALALPVVMGLVDVSKVRAQSVENPTFEAASVKPHLGEATDRNTLVPPTALPGGRFVSKFPLKFLLAYAYKVPFNQSARMAGIPDWAQGPEGTYDIEATSVMPPGLSGQARDERVRSMLQALLVDRFKLVIHRESKEVPVYALLVAKGGPKVQRADIDEKDCPDASLNALGPVSPSTPIPDVCHAFNGGMGRGLYARAANMSDLAAFVENWTDRPLLDKTGVKGLYRFETKGWLPMDPSVGAGSSELADRPTVFGMFEMLGLRMEAQKGVLDVYVIDHIEKPSSNSPVHN
jgi:uncharacterized protein (TIGR03435 family)